MPFLLTGLVLFAIWRFNRHGGNRGNTLFGSARFGNRCYLAKLEGAGNLIIGRSGMLPHDGWRHPMKPCGWARTAFCCCAKDRTHSWSAKSATIPNASSPASPILPEQSPKGRRPHTAWEASERLWNHSPSWNRVLRPYGPEVASRGRFAGNCRSPECAAGRA